MLPPENSKLEADKNIIIGNVALFGATGGQAYICGIAGERFCVRNSGATAVVEGCGDHGLEYMTGGTAVILGRTGRNLAAGMSGGIAYVLDTHHDLYKKINSQLVLVEEIETSYDKNELLKLIQKHYDETGSALAKKILDSFDEYIPNFKKIIPKDYKRMLNEISRCEEKGYSYQDAVMEAFKTITQKGA